MVSCPSCARTGLLLRMQWSCWKSHPAHEQNQWQSTFTLVDKLFSLLFYRFLEHHFKLINVWGVDSWCKSNVSFAIPPLFSEAVVWSFWWKWSSQPWSHSLEYPCKKKKVLWKSPKTPTRVAVRGKMGSYRLMSPGTMGKGLGSMPFFFPSRRFPEPVKAWAEWDITEKT